MTNMETPDIGAYEYQYTETLISGAYTVGAWVLRQTNGAIHPIFAHTTDNALIGYKSGANNLRVIAYNGGAADETFAVGLNTWDFIVVTRNAAGKVDAYKNGSAASRLFSDVAQVGSLRINLIGSNLTTYLPGSVAMPFIYNRALSAQEITNLYLATKGFFFPR